MHSMQDLTVHWIFPEGAVQHSPGLSIMCTLAIHGWLKCEQEPIRTQTPLLALATPIASGFAEPWRCAGEHLAAMRKWLLEDMAIPRDWQIEGSEGAGESQKEQCASK